MGYGHAEAFSFLLLARKVQASMACVTADDARSTGDNPYVEQALRSPVALPMMRRTWACPA